MVNLNWRDVNSYRYDPAPIPDTTYIQTVWIAWQFLRRNKAYQEDYRAYHKSVSEWMNENPECNDGSFGKNLPNILEYSDWDRDSYYFEKTDSALRWRELFREKWGLNLFMDPDSSYVVGEEFLSYVDDMPHLFKTVNIYKGDMEGPYVLLPVNLSEPIDDIQADFMARVKYLRAQGVRHGLFTTSKVRVQSMRLYVMYLRILDGFEAGATVQELGEVLLPHDINDSEARQRNKRIRAAGLAAMRLRDGGYKSLVSL